MLQAFSGTFGILTLCLVGYFAHRTRFIDEGTMDFMTRLASRIAIPCLLFNNALENITREFLIGTGFWLFIPFAVIGILYAAARLLAGAAGIRPSDTGVFCAMVSMPNTIAIGLPITLSIFGPSGIPYVMAFYIATTVLFWGYAVGGIARDGGHPPARGWEPLERIFSPYLVAFLLGTALNLLSLSPPAFLVSAIGHLGAMTTPLTLLLTGAILGEMGRDALRLDLPGTLALIGRLAVSPLVCVAFCVLAGVPAEMSMVYAVQAGLPSMNQVMLMSRYYGANERLGAQMLILTTLASIVTVPFVAMFARKVFAG